MSEPAPESKPASVPESAKDPWRVAFVEFKTRDEKMVKDYQEEIDTLLVVAGLFSAVLTAFVVESYQSLQEDYTKTSADLLRQISHQLANSAVPAAPESSHFHAQQSDVRVNACWFVSLLFSLVVALFGIFLKQWMRTYMKWTDVTPDREAVAIRHVRYRGLETWRLGAILTILPTLLQLSVILFLSGLLLFLWNLERMVAIVMAVLLSITFFLVATVTVLPAVFKSCPFRSPLSEILAVSFWRVSLYANFVYRTVWLFIHDGWTYNPDSRYWRLLALQWRDRSKITSWVKADEGVIDEYNSHLDRVSMHVVAMLHLCCTTQLQPLWTAAITTIVAEVPAGKSGSHFTRNIPDIIYWNEVWWPVLSHIIPLTEKDLGLGCSSIFFAAASTVRRFSSSAKERWLSFLLHSKTRASNSDSSLVVETYLSCCLASIGSTTGGPYMRAFMEVLEAQYGNLQESQLEGLVYCLCWVSNDVMFDSLSDIKFVESTKVICNGLSTMPIINKGHRDLLDVLVQLACHVAIATPKEPHGDVPENLQNLMRALQHVDAGDPSHQSYKIAKSCAPALIFVARHTPDLFPKPFARAIVHELRPVELWNVACDVEGLIIEGIDVVRIPDYDIWPDRGYLWQSLNARTPHATELLIAPHTFSRILDAYEEQVKQERLEDMQM